MYRLHRAMLAYQDARGQADSVISALSPAAWYRNATGVVSSGGFASIWADYASSAKGLALPGVAGNKASAPHIAAYEFGADSFTCVAWAEIAELGAWSVVVGAGKSTGADFRCFISVLNGLRLGWGTDAQLYPQSTGTVSANTLCHLVWGYNASSGKVFYAIDGVYEEIVAANNALSGSDSLIIGGDGVAYEFKGVIYACRVYDSALSSAQIAADYALGVSAGTSGAVFDADFSSQAIGAASFTESSSNAATVTINASGAAPAHIGKARDLLQGTGTNQPAYAAGVFTFDGADNFMRATFTLAQPTTFVLVLQMITWTSTDRIMDGNSANSTVLIEDGMGGGTPAFNMFAGSHACQTTSLAVGDFGIVVAVFNGASSLIRVNNNADVTGNVGANSSGGIVLGAGGGAGFPGNIAVKEAIAFSSALSDANRTAVISALNNALTVF